jgi:NlpC/P60 family/Bacterial dipeptidyl-peptidase Sh3 domain
MPAFNDPRLTPPPGTSAPYQVTAGVAAIRETPLADGRLATVALHGEVLDMFNEQGDFAQVQCRRDRYVGWVDVAALSAPVLAVTHKVSALRTYCHAEADLKSAPRFLLSLGARIVVEAIDGDWARCARAGWVHTRHLSDLNASVTDPVAVAEQFLHTPYLWGGRESLGLDCTGLTQQAFEAAGVILPRDSDMQADWAGTAIANWQAPGALRRGDLVFWRGHVGVMTDAAHLLHANAWHMQVAREPLSAAITRIAQSYGAPTGARRIDLAFEPSRVPDWLRGAA